MRKNFSTRLRSDPEQVPVLSIGSGAVEWLEGAALSSAEAPSNSPEDLAQAAQFAAGVEQFGERRCVLVLPEERFAVGVYSLPGLAEDELRTVLQRKAAQDLETDERDTLYCALPMGAGPDQPNGGGYCLWSIRRSEVHDLVHALRRGSIVVERVVAQRGGLLSCAQNLLGGESVPFIVAAVESERT